MGKYQGDHGRGKSGSLVQCPRCGYKWRVKNKSKPYICCSNCKRYFKPGERRGIQRRR